MKSSRLVTNYIGYYIKSLNKNIDGGFILVKSTKNNDVSRSYYFKLKKSYLTIRLSNHNLHESLIKRNLIDIIIDCSGYTVNGKRVEVLDYKQCKKSSFEYILLEIHLWYMEYRFKKIDVYKRKLT